MQIEKIAKLVDRMYFPNVPVIGTPSFDKFICSAALSVKRTLGNEHKVMFSESDAYADLANKTISLPTYIYSQAFLDRIGIEKKHHTAAAIACMNGLLCHEARHFRFTPIMSKPLKKVFNDAIKKFGKDFTVIYNIFEDIFIESQDWDKLKSLNIFMKAKSEIMLNQDCLNKFIDDIISNFYSSNKVLCDLVSFLRNDTLDFTFMQEIADYVFSLNISDSNLTHGDRIDLAIMFCEKFFDIEDIEQDEKDDLNVDMMKVEEHIDIDAEDNNDDKASNIAILSDANDLNEQLETLEKMHKQSDSEIESKIIAHYDHVSSIKSHDFMENEICGILSSHKKDIDWGRMLRRIKSSRKTISIADKRGSKIIPTRLSRIVTDGSIFSSGTQMKKIKGLEVIILMDFSGSTLTMFADSTGKSRTLWMIEMISGALIHKDLMKAGIPNKLMAHSTKRKPVWSDVYEEEECAVYEIASFRMSGRNTLGSELIKNLSSASRIPKQVNIDGIALQTAAKQFTKKPTQKLLITLSDGQPNGKNYKGKQAIEHTKQSVNDIRSQGIEVISLSVVKDVVEDNDLIYGKKHNVDATKNIEQQIRMVVQQYL